MQDVQTALKKISLFTTLPDEMLVYLAGEVHERQLSAGHVLFREGDKGDALYFVLDGTLEVTQKSGQDREIILATFNAGEYFGEMALLEDKPRSASARVVSDCRLLALDREDFTALLEKNPAIALQMTRAISERLRRTTPFTTRVIPAEAAEQLKAENAGGSGIKVFLSYSRRDKTFVQQIHDAIRKQGLDVWVDWENIPLTADWWAEIQRGIENADAFAFVISPDSVQSRVCGDEIQAAVNKNKRLIPILHREPGKEDHAHPSVAAANWVFMRTSEELLTNLPEMLRIINTDLDWVQDHTRLQARAGEWATSGRDTSFLLRGTDLLNAEKWLVKSEAISEPKPTSLHKEFINASLQEAKNSRLATQRQRFFLGSISFALIATLILSFIAFTSYRQAETNRLIAIGAQAEAETARDLASTNEALAQVQRATAEAASTAAIEQQQIAVQEANAASTAAAEEAQQREIALTQGAEADSQRVAAEAARVDANAQRDLALSRQRAAQAFSLIETAPDLAALLSLEAFKTSPSLEARSAILTILQRRLSRRIIPLRPIPDQLVGVYTVAISPTGERLAFGTEDGHIVIWNFIERRVEHDERVHSNKVIWSLAFSPDGLQLASGGNDSYVRIWNVSDFSEAHRFIAGSPALSVVWSPDGTRIASVAGPRVIAWTIADEEELYNTNLNYALNAIDWSPDGSKIAAASALRWVFIINGATGDTIGTLKGHTEDVQTVAWAPDSNLLASGGEDNTVRIWDTNEGQEIATLLHHTDQVFSVDFSQDGKILASGSEDRSINFWDMTTFQFIGDIQTNINSVQSVAFSQHPGENYLATASRDKTVGFYELVTEQPLGKILLSNAGQIKTLILRPDDVLEAIGNRANNLLLIWEVAENIDIPELPASTQNAQNAKIFAMSLDGANLASGYEDGRITLTDWATEEVILEFSQSKAVSALTFSADRQRLASSQCILYAEPEVPAQTATVCLQSEINIWDLNTGVTTLTLTLPDQITGLFQSLAFSADGNTLASGSDNFTILLWDLTTGQPIGLPLSRHRTAVTSLAFSPDGKTLASGSVGGTIILWEMETNQPIGEPLSGATGSVISLLFGQDGAQLYSGDSNGTILSWDLDTTSWFSRVCSLAGRNLTPTEWSQYLPDRIPYEETCKDYLQTTPTP